jgi:predicted DNA-binding protein with PD1-like motif
MKSAQLNDHAWVLRLEPGDDVLDNLQAFCAKNDINNASVEGIGSFDSPTLAHYSIKTKQFTDKAFTGIYEVTGLLGNIALVDGQPFAHIHATVSGPDMIAHAGHIVKAACSATLEIILYSYPSHHWKSQDDAIGLKVWDFEVKRSPDIHP